MHGPQVLPRGQRRQNEGVMKRIQTAFLLLATVLSLGVCTFAQKPTSPGAKPTPPGAGPTSPGASPTSPGANPTPPGASPTMPGANPTPPGAIPTTPSQIPNTAASPADPTPPTATTPMGGMTPGAGVPGSTDSTIGPTNSPGATGTAASPHRPRRRGHHKSSATPPAIPGNVTPGTPH